MNRRQILAGGGALALAGAGAAYLGVAGMGSMADYDAAVAAARRTLAAEPDAFEFIRYAALAPNGHNTQPWRFRVTPGGIDILPDFARRTPAVDPDDHHIFVSLGCAAENLALAAAARGRGGETVFDPASGGRISCSFGTGQAADTVLFDAIPHRQSTRAAYDGRAVAAADLAALSAAAAVPGVDLVLVVDRPRIDQVRDLVLAGNSAQMADPAFVAELKSWLRFNPHQALQTGDGLFSAATANPVVPAWLGGLAFDWFVTADGENEKYAAQLRTSSGVAIFAGAQADPDHWVRTGRACQRFALQATALGMKLSFVNQPVEVAALRSDLAALAGLPGRRPDIVLRFGYGPALPFSARRPVASVIVA
jgi:hypothetical protein